MNRQNNNVLFCHHYSTSLMNKTDFPINSFSNRFSSLSNRNSIQTRNYAKKSKKKGAGGGKKKRKKGAGEGDPNNIVITLHDIEKHFRDGVQIFSNVTMGAFHGAKIGVVGVNGAGKSCLLKIIAGVDEDFEGERIIKDGYKIGYLAQEPKLDETKDVKGNVLDGIADKLEMLERHSELSEKIKNEEADEDEIEEHKKLKFSCDALQLWGLDKRIYKAMDALRCPPPESSLENLSGGERRRVALCQLLVSQPDILLLDEPTNHLDANSVAWLQTYLQGYRGTVIAITHDRYFLDGCAGWIAELDRGRMIPFQGNYTEWLQAKAIRLQQEAKRDKNREKMLNKELEWINSPQKARQAKSRARVTAYEERLNEAKAKPYESGTIVIPPGRRLGGVVLEVKGLSKSFGDRKLFDNVSFELKAGQILGIIGANGTGKTSLLRILTGEDEADSGTVRIGETVDLGYVTQSRDSLDSENTVFEEIAGQSSEIDLGSHVVNSRAYVAAFNFSGDAQQKRVGNLSGGERNRVHLAKMIQRAPNVLLLDEPTNDLDVEVLRNLENSLADFTGSGVVVSHDRWFLDRVCTHILELGQEEVEVYEGTFAQYEEFMKEQNKKTALSGEKKSVSRSAFRKLGI